MKPPSGVRLIDSSNLARATFNWANTAPALILERNFAGTGVGTGQPSGLFVRPEFEFAFSGSDIGRGVHIDLAGNAGHDAAATVVGVDIEPLANPSAATEVAIRVGPTGWDADLLTKDHNLAVQSAALPNPPAGELKIYARDDINQGAGTVAVDCALVASLARTSVGTETVIAIVVTDGFCP